MSPKGIHKTQHFIDHLVSINTKCLIQCYWSYVFVDLRRHSFHSRHSISYFAVPFFPHISSLSSDCRFFHFLQHLTLNNALGYPCFPLPALNILTCTVCKHMQSDGSIYLSFYLLASVSKCPWITLLFSNAIKGISPFCNLQSIVYKLLPSTAYYTEYHWI